MVIVVQSTQGFSRFVCIRWRFRQLLTGPKMFDFERRKITEIHVMVFCYKFLDNSVNESFVYRWFK